MDCMEAGADSILCSTICMSAVYWLSMSPENMPAPLVRNAGKPTLRAGLLSLFILRSDKMLIIVMAVPAMSMGRETGEPWKLAPDSCMFSSGKNIGLSPTPFSSISTCERA